MSRKTMGYILWGVVITMFVAEMSYIVFTPPLVNKVVVYQPADERK